MAAEHAGATPLRGRPAPATSGHFNNFCVKELTDDGATGIDTDTDPAIWSGSSSQGGSGMTSTLADLGTWAASTSGNSTLSPELATARVDTTTDLGSFNYALGIFQMRDGWYGHAGEALGWQALAVHDPTTRVSLVMASNVCAAQDLFYWSILTELYPDAALDATINKALGA